MNNGLKIAFFGSSLVSAYWNGAATYYRGVLKSLHELGYQITFYEPDAFERQQHRDITDPDYAKIVVYQAEEKFVKGMLEDASSSDIIIKASGVGVFDDLLEKSVLELQSRDKLIIFWDVDAPATLDRIRNNPFDYFAPLISQYDLILTYGGGDPVIEGYKELGANRCIPIYNALDPSSHFPVQSEEKFSSDLSFLGNRMPDRESRVWEFFFKPAQLLPDKRFLLAGNGWGEYVPEIPNVKYLGHVYTHEHNAFNCTPKAVLNISRESMARYGFSPATRVFEAAGAGGCIITDAWKGIELFLKPGIECLVAYSGDEVADYMKQLTDDQKIRIGEAARSKITNKHTYKHRAEQVHNIFSTSPKLFKETEI